MNVFRHRGTSKAWIIVFLVLILPILVMFYSLESRKYYAEIPVKFGLSKVPLIEVEIEGNPYLVNVDLGSFMELQLHSDLIEPLKKTPNGTITWICFNGTQYSYPKYIIPKMEIASLNFNEVTAVAYPKQIDKETNFSICQGVNNAHPQKNGVLGLGILQSVNLLFDLKNSKIIASNSLKKLKTNGYDIASYVKVPFTQSKLGVLIDIETDLGTKKFLFDTGATYTFLHSNQTPEGAGLNTSRHGFPMMKSRKFMIGSTFFGTKNVYFLNLTEELMDIDGILGADFINQHKIYIDFEKQSIYIQPWSAS